MAAAPQILRESKYEEEEEEKKLLTLDQHLTNPKQKWYTLDSKMSNPFNREPLPPFIE